jgi:hypothetical protein
MPKSGSKIGSKDPRQMSLLDLLQQNREPQIQDEEGSLNIHGRLCRALTMAINNSGLSRWEIAGRMSHLLGTEITKFQIDGWTAESKEGHRIPAEYLPAFCRATGCFKPIEILAELTGMFALPGPDALRAEIQKLNEEERRLKTEKRKREMFLKEMEGHQ